MMRAVALLFALWLVSGGCTSTGTTVIEPKLKILGDASWFGSAAIDTSTLVQLISEESDSVCFEWPPAERTPETVILFDVSGSMFREKVVRGTQVTSLAMHDLDLLRSFLRDHGLYPGERLSIVLFGHDCNDAGMSIKSDTCLRLPFLRICARSRIYTRLDNQLELKILQATRPDFLSSQYSDPLCSLISCSIAQIEDRRVFCRSTFLLAEVDRAIQQLRAKGSRKYSIIVVTDGWFQTDRVDFRPSDDCKTRLDLEFLTAHIEAMGLRPQVDSNDFPQVFLIGLNDGNNECFRQKQNELFKWLFGTALKGLLHS